MNPSFATRLSADHLATVARFVDGATLAMLRRAVPFARAEVRRRVAAEAAACTRIFDALLACEAQGFDLGWISKFEAADSVNRRERVRAFLQS